MALSTVKRWQSRDNPADTLHFGKEVSLKIYDQREIAAGQSRYQIAQQPVFKARSAVLPNRRGDFMLLINGMPLIHCELKRSGVDVSQAYNQIEKYAHEGYSPVCSPWCRFSLPCSRMRLFILLIRARTECLTRMSTSIGLMPI